jgi:hypothetical protein
MSLTRLEPFEQLCGESGAAQVYLR